MKLQVGKLYSCKEYYLLLFPDKESADVLARAVAAATPSCRTAASRSAFWTEKFKKPVSYCDLGTPLLVLNAENEYVEVLVGDKPGWIVNEEWFKIEEISYP